jgi:amino acid transporter
LAQQKSGEHRSLRTSVKGPLMFSAFWAVLAFVAVLIFATGGSAKAPRFDLAFTAAGIAFIVTLVMAAMLSMSYKDNAEHLGKGSGVNLSSKRPAPSQGGHAPQSGPDAGPDGTVR